MSIKDSIVELVIKAKNLLSSDVDDAASSLDGLKNKSKDLRAHLKKLEDQKALIKQFEKQDKSVTNAAGAYDLLVTRTKALKNKIKETGDPTGRFAVQLEKTEAAAKKSARALSSKNVELNKLKLSLKSSNIDTAKLAATEATLNKQISKSKTVLTGFTKQMRSLGKATADTEKVSSKFSLVTAAYWTAGILAVKRIATEIKNLTVDMLTTGDKFEGLRIQMDALMGSIEGGEKATEWIKAFTQNTPLQLEQVTETFARLKAFGLDPMDGTMQAIIDQSEKLGGGMERVEGISLALGQAWAKQKLQGEEILQLVERGVPVWDLLEKATGRNAVELQKLSSAGKLGRDVIKQLTAEIGKSANGAAAANMGRLSGIVSNLKDQLQLFLNEIAESGALDYAKQQLSELSKTIKEMAADGSLKEWAKGISDALISFVNGAKKAAKALYDFKDVIAAVAKAALALKLTQMFLGFGAAAAQAVTSLLTVQGGIAATTARAKVLSTVLKASLIGAVTALAIGLYELADAWTGASKAEEQAAKSADLAKVSTQAKTKRLKELSEQLGINITSMKQFLDLEDKGVIVFDKTTNSYRKSNEELKKRSELQKHNADVMAQSVLPAVDTLKAKFEELQRSGATATDAVAQLAKSIDVENPENIQTVVDTLKKLKDQGQLSAAQIETGLRIALKNLNDKELAELKKNAPETFAALGVSIQSVANDVDPLRAEFTKLGLDLNELRGGFTDTGREALSAFDSISKSATASADDISNAFDGVLAKTSTKAEGEALRVQIESLGKTGKVSGEQLEEMLLKVENKIADVTPGIGSLEEAYKSLGIKSKASLAETAESLKASYELIRSSIAPIEDKRAAFIAYAQAAIEANGGVISSELEIQASVLDVTSALNDQKKAVDHNRDKWVNRAAAISKANQSIVDAANAERHAVEGAAKSTWGFADAIRASADETDLAALSVDGLADKIDSLESRIASNGKVTSKWFKNIAKGQVAFDKQTLAIARQTLKLRELEAAFSATELPTVAMVNHTSQAIKTLNKLDDAQLSNLNSQLDTARSKLLSLQESAASALASVQDEIDRELGNQNEIENRSYQSKITTLEAQLAEAKRYKNSAAIKDLQKTIKLTEKLHRLNLKEIEADKKKQEKATAETIKSSPLTLTEPIAQTVNVKLELGGSRATIPTTEAGKDDLLALLTKNQLVTG